LSPAFGRVTGVARTRQVILRPQVAALADGLRRCLVLPVAARAGCGLVSPDELHRMAGQLRALEPLRCVAQLAVRPIVSPRWRLVAERAFETYGLLLPLVAVEALGIGMTTLEVDHVLCGIQWRPRLGRLVTVATDHPRYRIVGTDVTRSAVGKLCIQLPFDMAIQADVHGANHVPADRIEPVADGTMAIATVHTDRHTVGELVVRRPQPVFRQLVGQIPVACQTGTIIPYAGIGDHPNVHSPHIPFRLAAMVAGHAVDLVVG
jgi:hypothetical protein